jgi:hypothetical protein
MFFFLLAPFPAVREFRMALMRHTLDFGGSLPSGAYRNGMKIFSPLLVFSIICP